MEVFANIDENEKVKTTRNVESLRKSYHKEFLLSAQKTKACTECQASTKSIVFYRSRFIYEGKDEFTIIIMAIGVVEFSREGYKIRKVFACPQEIIEK